jgi:hypothetical protein
MSYRHYPHESVARCSSLRPSIIAASWCLITRGHAMALIDCELFKAESKGLDWRKLIAVYQMQP